MNGEIAAQNSVKTNSFLVWNILTKMEKLMDNPNLWHIQVLIFENLNCDSLMKCRRVCKSWSETLRRMSDVKFLQEFGDFDVLDLPLLYWLLVVGAGNNGHYFPARDYNEHY